MTTSSVTGRWWSPVGQVGNAAVSHIDLSPHPDREAEAFSWLDEEERARACRFVSAGPRRGFALCRAALRALLCDELRCSNERLAFGATEHGKPFAIVQGLPARIGFNVSHSGKHGLIALAPEGRLGVDVEECVPHRNLDTLIETVFTPDERAELALIEGEDRHRAFFRLWTVKEALVKAEGTGLSLDPSLFEVPPAMRRGARSAVFAFPQTPSVRWRVESFDGDDFVAAVRSRTGPGDLMRPREAVWELPEPLSVHEVRVDDETVITVRRHGNPDGPRLIMSHGNGLAIDLYYPFWSLLTGDFDIIVHDLRNHGWNKISSLEGHHIPTLAADHDRILEAVNLRYGEKPTTGVFHSVSALVSLLSLARGSGYSALVLFDPPLCKPGRGYEDFDIVAANTAALARRRTEHFHSMNQLVEVLPLSPLYRRVLPGVFDLVARTTLRRSDDGEGYQLRCPREYEARMIEYAGVYAMGVDFDSLRCPVKVIGADPTLPFSYLPTLDLSDIESIGYDFLPDATHFLQLEQPDECVETMLAFLHEVGAV